MLGILTTRFADRGNLRIRLNQFRRTLVGSAGRRPVIGFPAVSHNDPGLRSSKAGATGGTFHRRRPSPANPERDRLPRGVRTIRAAWFNRLSTGDFVKRRANDDGCRGVEEQASI